MSKVKWTLDAAHSELTFKVKHLMISTVTGQFKIFNVIAETEDIDFTNPVIELTADVSSLTTNNEQRDTHLRSDEFFDAANYNQLLFKSTAFEGDKQGGKVTGRLTIRGTTKTVTLQVEHGGIVVDPYGQTKAGFTVAGKLSRKDFGLTWNAVTETGGVVVGDEVKIQSEIQLIMSL